MAMSRPQSDQQTPGQIATGRIADGPIRVAIIGCGAVAQQFHLPVLAGHGEVRLVAAVDRDLERARRIARDYRIDQAVSSLDQLSPDRVDAALVATPPAHHADSCIDLAERGIHTLVEKPMAPTLAESIAMVEAAERAGVVLTVGLFRRLLPSTELLRALVAGRAYGRVVAFSVRSGAFYGWPSATLGNMRRDQAGGGVLLDMGAHVLDMLLHVLPGQAEVLKYQHNSLGGIESDCAIQLRIQTASGPVEGTVEMSRTRKRPGGIRITCESAVLALPLGENRRVTIHPQGWDLRDPSDGQPRDARLSAQWDDAERRHDGSGYAAFRAQTDDWLTAIRTGREPQLSGRSALPSIELIESCYGLAEPLVEPWVTAGLPSERFAWRKSVTSNGPSPARIAPVAPAASGIGKRVLITGASGFIGCRVAELLHLRDGWQVRALVHNPANAARLARLPVEIIQGDVRSSSQMHDAVADCDAVVHCAIGTSYGQDRTIFDVTVGGTQSLVEAALAARVGRFVHLSTIAVYGNEVLGEVDEQTPLRPGKHTYNLSKARAEQVVQQAVQRGLPAVLLRLANIYGPFGRTFVIDPIEKLAAERFRLIGGDRAVSNTVFVDDVVGAIRRALEPDRNQAVGEVFCLGADDRMTWEGYFGYFAKDLGVPLVSEPGAVDDSAQSARRAKPPSQSGWLGGLRAIATSAELRAMARKVLETDPYGALPRWTLQRCPAIEDRLRSMMGLESATIYRHPNDNPGPGVMTRRPRSVVIRSEKANRLLDYHADVPRSEAMRLTLDWIRHALVSAVDQPTYPNGSGVRS